MCTQVHKKIEFVGFIHVNGEKGVEEQLGNKWLVRKGGERSFMG